ncbi:MAG: diacylglycerol kinase family protein [Bacteroidota bacterium]|nr:diacylglycerol kinase family protein [Bacteroidota bacterium]
MGSTSKSMQHVFSPRRVFKSFGYAITGLKDMLRTEQNARFHLVVSICVLIASALFHLSGTEWCIVLLCIALVWAGEAFNTAVETITDHLFHEFNETARIIKDVSAGAVFVCAMISIICGIIIFLPKILNWLF